MHPMQNNNGRFSPARRSMLIRTAALGLSAAASPLLRAQPAPGADPAIPAEFVEVDTFEGRLRGQKQNGICIFRGVRYAGAPVGAARFKAPPPLKKWQGVRDALVWGHPALQPPRQSFGVEEPAPDEDCLLLNVWTPAVDDCAERTAVFSCRRT